MKLRFYVEEDGARTGRRGRLRQKQKKKKKLLHNYVGDSKFIKCSIIHATGTAYLWPPPPHKNKKAFIVLVYLCAVCTVVGRLQFTMPVAGL